MVCRHWITKSTVQRSPGKGKQISSASIYCLVSFQTSGIGTQIQLSIQEVEKIEFSIWGGQHSQNLQGIILEKKIQRQKSSDLQRASLSLQLSTKLCMHKQLLETGRWERTHWNHKALPLELIHGQEQFMFPLVRGKSY